MMWLLCHAKGLFIFLFKVATDSSKPKLVEVSTCPFKLISNILSLIDPCYYMFVIESVTL